MNKKIIVVYILIVILIAAIGYVYTSIPRVAYVSTNKVYNEYKGKIDYQKKLESEESSNNKILDTLKFEIDILSEKVRVSSNSNMIALLQNKVNNYERLRGELDDHLLAQKQQYIEDIWKQINKYVEEYGSNSGYDYIYGAEGTGALMYASKDEDITDDVISFINKKYEGK